MIIETFKNKLILFKVLTILLFLFTGITDCLSETIDIDIKSYKADKQYASDVSLKSANNKQYLIGQGDASFDFTTQTQGWYELWVEAASWDTKTELDGKLLGYFNFMPLGTNTKTGLNKIANLYLNAGSHQLRFVRLQFPGLPYISTIKVIAATQLQSKLSLAPVKDYLTFRKDEAFPLKLTIAKEKTTNKLLLDMVDQQGITQKNSVIDIPAGTGNYETTVQAPTNLEGAFLLKARLNDTALSAVEIDYAVIDTQAKLNLCAGINATTSKELVLEIDPTKIKPDYFSELPNIINDKNIAYLESGNKGVYQNIENPSYFAYKIKVPTVVDNYLVEVDYPDDKSRTFSMSLIENDFTLRQIDSGVTMGYFYPLSGETRTHQISFFPRIKEPRLLFINWDSDGRIAIQKIRLYKIKIPQCKTITNNSTRSLAYYYEENLRYPAYFGGKNNSWADLIKTTERWANWSSNMGVNRWVQAIASYRTKMWPSEVLPGYAMTYNDGTSFNADFVQHDPVPKDVFRLLLLMGEKYGIAVNGELQLPIDKTIEKTFPSFVTDKNKSYLIQNKNQLPPTELGTPYQAYLNPTHPEVVNWVSSIFSELEGRYNSYSAFEGLTMRFMPWEFHSWQAYPSINWGYDSYSLNKFMADSKLNGALSNAATQFNVLNTTYYDKWVSWRQSQVMNNFNIYKKVLTKNNKNLKLYLQFYGPVYSINDFQQMGGNADHNQNELLQNNDWKPLLQEAGINLDMISTDKQINAGNSFSAPSGLRDRLLGRPIDSAGQYQRQNRDDLVTLFCKTPATQESCTQNFYNEYLEIDFPLKAIGMAPINDVDNKKIRLAAAVEPSGAHTLEKYTTALYNGNITALSYGGLGYILGQPKYIDNFSREYLSLPAIPMQSHKNMPEPVALWYGTYGNKAVMYLVNSAHYPVSLNLLANESVRLRSLTSSQIFEGNQISMMLQPYQLLAFEANKTPAKFIRATLGIPLGIDKLFDQQINFVKNLIANNPNTIKNKPALKLRYDKLLQYHVIHKYRSMRLSLLSPEFIELYTTTNQFPPWLLFDAPPAEYSINTPFTTH
jgi:hypothetical protein